MTQRRDPLGLLEMFWRNMERIFGTRRSGEEGNPGAAAAETLTVPRSFIGVEGFPSLVRKEMN